MRKLTVMVLVIFLCLGLAACAKPVQPLPSVTPLDLKELPGQWMQLVPVAALPERLTLDEGGHAQTDKDSGTWRVQDAKLWLRIGSQQTPYDYTVSGYMMTLVNATGESSFYINPQLFDAEGTDDGKFTGQWAAYSTNGMLLFDGKGTLQDIFYDTSAGRTTRDLQYTARDGILQAIDPDGNVIYNLYTFEEDCLKLGEASEYDSDDKSWTTYWKKSEPGELLNKWTRMVNQTASGAAQLPQVLELQPDGKALETPAGGNPTPIDWEYYDGGFVVLRYSDTNVQYAYAFPDGPTMALDSNDGDARCWYATDSLRAALAAPKAMAGKWTCESPALALSVSEDGAMTFTLNGKDYPAIATAAGSLLVVRQNNKTYYIAYELADTQLTLMYENAPFLPDGEQTLVLTKE